jgi:hypothetical protein
MKWLLKNSGVSVGWKHVAYNRGQWLMNTGNETTASVQSGTERVNTRIAATH